MSFVWPQEKVAFDIVNGGRPHRCIVPCDSEFVILTATCAELDDYQVFQNIANALCALREIAPSKRTAQWFAENSQLFEGIKLTFGDSLYLSPR